MTDLPRSSGVLVGDRYRLVERVGAGGLAEVWRAVDEVLARPVAVKLLHPHLAGDRDARAAVLREASAAARLHHPHLVDLYDTVLDHDPPGLVFELVDGTDLRRRLAEGPMPAAEVARLGRDLADALDHVHAAGMVHGDVKPANVLLGDDGRVLLADVGLARAAQDVDATRPTADAAGTARYLAPEVLEGEPPTAASDLYSLGTVLFEAVTGRRTFEASTEAAAAVQRLQREPARTRHLRPDVPRHLDDIVHRLLRRRPGDRFASAAELRAAFDLVTDRHHDRVTPPPAHGESTPPSGLPPTFREAERRWIVPAVVIVIAGLGLLAATVLFGSTDAGRELFRGAREAVTGDDRAERARLASAASFDPLGDGEEHDERVADAIDGDPASTWITERYRQSDFGTKAGVGLAVVLARTGEVAEVTVTTPTPGWRATVMVAPAPAATLDGWTAVADLTLADTEATVSVDDVTAGAVLVWITDLGPAHQVEIGEVEVRAR